MEFVSRSSEARAARASADTVSRRAAAAVDLRPEAAERRALIQAMRSGSAATAQLVGGPEEEELQMKQASGALQAQGLEDEEPMQMRRSWPTAGVVPRGAEPRAPRSEGGLPSDLKAGVEALSGFAMDDVKVHYNSSQPAQLNALAYAQGSDIHLAPGQEQHLPHEAWHVVQQAQGRVQPTMQMKGGVPVNDDEGLEREADVMGAKALSSVAQPRKAPGSELVPPPR